MPAPSTLPKYLYKIVPEAPPYPLPEEYPLSDLDRNDGFIHLSTAEQVLSLPLAHFNPHSGILHIEGDDKQRVEH